MLFGGGREEAEIECLFRRQCRDAVTLSMAMGRRHRRNRVDRSGQAGAHHQTACRVGSPDVRPFYHDRHRAARGGSWAANPRKRQRWPALLCRIGSVAQVDDSHVRFTDTRRRHSRSNSPRHRTVRSERRFVMRISSTGTRRTTNFGCSRRSRVSSSVNSPNSSGRRLTARYSYASERLVSRFSILDFGLKTQWRQIPRRFWILD